MGFYWSVQENPVINLSGEYPRDQLTEVLYWDFDQIDTNGNRQQFPSLKI